jgi:hypothetical protein
VPVLLLLLLVMTSGGGGASAAADLRDCVMQHSNRCHIPVSTQQSDGVPATEAACQQAAADADAAAAKVMQFAGFLRW